MTLGDLIKKFRNDNNITMQEFANSAKMSKGYVCMLEANKHPKTGEPIKPSLDVLTSISNAMGISITELLNIIDSDTKVEISSENKTNKLSYGGSDKKIIKADDFTYALYEETKDLTEEQKDALLQMAKAFKSKK